MIARTFRKPTFAKPLASLVGSLLVAMVALDSASVTAQQGRSPATGQGRKITLSDQLTLGLRARSKADQAFVGKVVVLVEQGKLPRALVDSTFLWARERAARYSRSRRLRPMVYFQPGLRMRAKRIGVRL